MNSSRRNRLGITLMSLSSLVMPNTAFMPKPTKTNVWQLRNLISADELDAEYDVGLGGVRLAQESAIKIAGHVNHKPGKADTQPMELLRYTALQKVDEAAVNGLMDKIGSKVICTGQGVEFYKDPGNTLEEHVEYAPMEAIKDAVARAGPAIDCENLVFNFLGGDDLMMGEVMDAANEMVLMMDIATKANISFNSLCHSSIPSSTCAVTVVSVGDGEYDGKDGVEKAVASGEVYLREGTWYTVQESEINTAIE